MDLFERVKQHVNILTYIQSDLHSDGKRVGDGSYRIIPCPFCESKTGFTVNERQQFFRCFADGCGVKGDVIEYERMRYGLVEPKEAAESVAGKCGLSLNAERGTRNAEEERGKKGSNAPPPPEPPPFDPDPEPPIEDTPAIDPERACEVRAAAAAFYHEQLLKDAGALRYQTEKRGHSLEILKACQVGYSRGAGLIKAMKAQNIDVDELAAVGLVRRQGKGWREYIAKGMTVYPHSGGERVLFFTIKDPTKERKYQIKKQFAGQGWLCWGQDALDQDEPVVIVEGENDRLSVMDTGQYPHVIATIGAFNEPAILGAIKEHSKEQIYFLGFDADPDKAGKQAAAGSKYTRKYAAAILAGGGTARDLGIRLTEDGGKQDIDDILSRAKDPKAKLLEMMKDAKAIRKAERETGNAEGEGGKKGKGGRVPAPDPRRYLFESFEVLGELENNSILFWSRVNQRLYTVDLNSFKLEKLVQIGGMEVSMRVARAANAASDGQVLFQDLRKRLIVQASESQLWDPEFVGQGIHSVGGVILVVVGGDTWVWDGKQMKPYSRPILADQVIERKKGHEWVDFAAVQKRMAKMTREEAYKIIEELANWIFQWRFRGPLDGWIVLGWILAQYVQSLWAWRPHLWLAGPAASGKTSLRDLVGTIGGRLTLECEGQTLTEPGLRQGIGTDSCLVLIDEMEKSQQREAIIQYIRSAGRGGWTRKGATDQRGVKARIRHMVFLSSIERGLHRAADISRYLRVETAKSEGIVLKMPDSAQTEDLRVKVVAYVLWAAFRANKLITDMARVPGHDPRFIESLRVPFAMVAASMEDPETVLEAMVKDYLEYWEADDSDQDMSDEEMVLKDIFLSHVKVPVHEQGELRADGTYGPGRIIYPARTLGQLLEDEELSDEHKRILEAHGCKATEKGLFLQPEKVAQELLKGSQWEGYMIRELLKRIPGAAYGRSQAAVRLAGTVARGVLLPWEACPSGEPGQIPPGPWMPPGAEMDEGASPTT